MSEKEKANLFDTISILMQLDKQSLLLIDSGARLLAARQDMDRDFQRDKQLQEASIL